MKTKLFVLAVSLFVIFITACEPKPSVNEGDKPTADFNSTDFPEMDSVDATVQFTNLSTNADSYLWTFEGAQTTTSTEKNPKIKWDTAGTYNVKLVATNSNGSCEKTATVEIRDRRASMRITFINQSNPPKTMIYFDIHLGGGIYPNLYADANNQYLFVGPHYYVANWLNSSTFFVVAHLSNGATIKLEADEFQCGGVGQPNNVSLYIF